MKSKIKTRTGDFEITAYPFNDFPNKDIIFEKKRKRKRTLYFYNKYLCLDTETSRYNDDAWIYQWAVNFDGLYIYGRKPSEFIIFLNILKSRYNLSREKIMLIYVHNLSYDMQYLKHYLFEYDSEMSILATDTHKYLQVDILGFKLICSYRLTNLSLDLLAKNYAETYQKAAGEIDYTITRYQDSDLSDSDWFYMFSDVASQYDGIEGYLSAMGYDKAYRAPITSTGFVRQKCREASQHEINWKRKFYESRLTLEQYNLLRHAFMGGVTICSWQHAGDTIRGAVRHRDFTSSYPARQMIDYFPKGKGMWYGRPPKRDEFNILLKKYCCIFVATFENIRIRPGITAPYIPSSKCIHKNGDLKVNGKIVFAESLSIALTEIDYDIICRQYTAENINVSDILLFNRGPAPKWLKNNVMDFFRMKTDLKKSDPRLYMASKNLLNSIYGMTATSIVREEFKHDHDLILTKNENDPQKQIDDYYDNYNSFLPYQFGLYTTAHARKALIDMIETVGYDKFLYCDTDSIFYLSDEGTEQRLAEMNARITERAKEAGAVYKGEILGVATEEPILTAFRALHAKCYAMEEGGTLKVTIAGIPKSSVKWINGRPVRKTNSEELGDIDNLNDGYVFRHCGGTRIKYVERESDIIKINGHMTEISSAAIIESIEKEISENMWTVGENYEILKVNYDENIDYSV